LCAAKDTISSCQVGYYKTDDTPAKCSTCSLYNVRQCTEALTDGKSTGIEECNAPDVTNYYYFISGKGCIGHPLGNKCKTIKENPDSAG